MKITFSLIFIIYSSFITYLVYSTPFYPIQAGTFRISHQDLKGLNQIQRIQILLQTPYQIFKNNHNIEIVCAISSINIDQRVGFEINYKLTDHQKVQRQKIIQILVIDRKGFEYPQLEIQFDFLIAQDLRTDFYNMTDWQQHLSQQSKNQQQMNASNKIVHNQLYLFPNGFSSINLTSDVMYGYVTQPYDMYTIHYMSGKNNLYKHGWIQKQNFILLRWVLYPRYPFGFKQCGGLFQPQLKDDFYFQCDKKGVDGYFYGLSGYSGKKFVGSFHSSGKKISVKIENMDAGAKYNIVAFPFKISEKFNFIDNRKYQISTFSLFNKFNFKYLIAIIIIILIIALIVYFIRRKNVVYFDLQQEKTEPIKKNISKQKTNSDGQQKNSDQELKEQNMYNSIIITTQSEKDKNKDKDNYSIS